MSSDLIRCCFCFTDYDLDTHSPVMLSQCGHNTCETWAKGLVMAHPMECPLCGKRFPSSPHGTKYVPNRHIRERLEKENQYQRCPVHEQLMELYCVTDKRKICIDCYFTKGERSHKDHEVERIIDLKGQLEAKKKVYEECREKCRMTYETGKNLVEKSKLTQFNSIKELERVTRLLVVESELKARSVYDKHEAKIEEAYGANSTYMEELNSKLSQYQDLKTSNLHELLDCNVEEVTNSHQFSQSKEYLEKFTEEVSEAVKVFVGPTITQNTFKISIEAPGTSPALKINGALSFQLEGACLTVTGSNVVYAGVTLDLDKWEKEVKKVKFVFDGFYFAEEDMRVLAYVWLRLQPYVISITLSYQDTNESLFEERLEDHLHEFSRAIFSQPETLQEIGLLFNEASGCQYWLRFLSQRILPKSSNLTSLHLAFDNTDLEDTAITKFIMSSKPRLNNLYHLSFNLNQQQIIIKKNLALKFFDLPNLKSFNLSTNRANFEHQFSQDFIRSFLSSMKSLESFEFTCQGADSYDLDALVNFIAPISNIKSLKITMPDVHITKSIVDKHKNDLKSRGIGHELLELNVIVESLSMANFMGIIRQSNNILHSFLEPSQLSLGPSQGQFLGSGQSQGQNGFSEFSTASGRPIRSSGRRVLLKLEE